MKKILIFTILVISFFNYEALGSCNFKTAESIKSLNNPKYIRSITIETPKVQKYNLNFAKILTSKSENIPPNLRKKFNAKLKIQYAFGECEFKAKIRQSGDWRDHIRLEKGKPLRSLDVALKEGNILNAVKFKLLIPDTRNGINEILGSLILKENGFLVPETFLVKTKVNGEENEMIFQENSVKELLERNLRREGPIFEGDESLFWSYKNFENFELENISLSRLLNSNWFKKGKNFESISLISSQKLQMAYAQYIKDYFQTYKVIFPNFGKIDIFKNYYLLLESMNGTHALRPHNRKFYYNVFDKNFEPIYYDGSFNLISPIKNFKNLIYDEDSIDQIDVYLKFLKSEENKEKLLQEFSSRVLQDYNHEVFFNKSIEQIIKNLTLIKEKSLLNDPIYVPRYYSEENLSKLKNNYQLQDLDYSFIKKIEAINDEYLIEIETSKNEFSKRISSTDLANILSKNIFEKNRLVFVPIKLSEFSNDFKKYDFNNGKIIYSNNISFKIDEETKSINIFQKYSTDWILFQNIVLDGWNINFNGKETIFNKSDQNINNQGLTGCLNFYKISFRNTNIEINNGACEDSINIVNSSGIIYDLKIEKAFSDALDLDFSNIEIKNIKVINANNDCTDFSGGQYIIYKATLNNCGDKGISIGEKSTININNTKIENSLVGVASKDSSVSNIKNISFNNVEVCLTAYNKKQEFYGSLIYISNFECNNFIKEDEVDEKSKIFYKF